MTFWQDMMQNWTKKNGFCSVAVFSVSFFVLSNIRHSNVSFMLHDVIIYILAKKNATFYFSLKYARFMTHTSNFGVECLLRSSRNLT